MATTPEKDSGDNASLYKVLSGLCPDDGCKTRLFFPAYDRSVECTGCGQRHNKSTIKDVSEVTNPDVALHKMLHNVLLGHTKPKKGADTIKVLGLSNYHCKLLSPLLARYGMCKQTGEAKLLTELGQKPVFDCSVLGDRAFLIEPDHIKIKGYGKDRTGSVAYLADTLSAIQKANDNVECLLPIHSDGDGHCLVHAVSRALIGRELFWHPLRENLKTHFEENLSKYKPLFKDFIGENEWENIIAECDPYYIPPDGEALGLRNIHIFGLANVLRRPIILLDSMTGLKSSGDYAGLFLPGLMEPAKCRGKDGTLNKPLCLAWSNSGRNHYIALVAVKGRPVPKIPRWMLPNVWSLPLECLEMYIEFDSEGNCLMGGNKCLGDRYVQRLVAAIEAVFVKEHKVAPSVVADVHQYVYKSSGMVGVPPEVVLQRTVDAIEHGRLFRCLTCEATLEWSITTEWLKSGGTLHRLAVATHGDLKTNKRYSFPLHGLVCTYNSLQDQLEPDMSLSTLQHCAFCKGSNVRQLNYDGSIQYKNGDRTTTPAEKTRCQCGFKHYWDGKEYDNIPEIFPITLEWAGKVVGEKVVWFQYESIPDLNSNVYEVAQKLVQKHFPGEFGSERLVQKVTNTILVNTAKLTKKDDSTSKVTAVDEDPNAWKSDAASKIILTGQKKRTLHKEELHMSEAEKEVRRQIESNAAIMQRRRTRDEIEMKSKGAKAKQKAEVKTPEMSKVPPAASSPRDPMSDRTIRITTSDGRQKTLEISPGITYDQFTEKISLELDIPKHRQKIRSGFPPKVLQAPDENHQMEPLALQHGDRVSVEILPDPEAIRSSNEFPTSPPVWQSPSSQPRQSWSTFEHESKDHSATELLKGLDDMQNGGDSLDMSIASLTLMATLTGKDLWSYSQAMPHLFSVGGLFYEQVKRDMGLVDGQHCTLPAIPGKLFRYNAADSRLELCLEPHGHFPVAPGIEEHILQSPALPKPPSSDHAHIGNLLASGSSGVVTNPTMKIPSMPFSGQGHSLLSNAENIRMPGDIEPRAHNHRSKAAKVSGLLGRTRSESIEEEPELENTVDMDTATDSVLGATDSDSYKRVGPGQSVLDRSAHTDSSVHAHNELFNNLVASIQETVMEEEESNTSENVDTDKVFEDNTLQPASVACASDSKTICKSSPKQEDTISAKEDSDMNSSKEQRAEGDKASDSKEPEKRDHMDTT
ncbi:unnamed protein product [Owenia fusiformis]|uniref:ubiquitinyl hydrolase 1 n=1 Tax=Owenia fusiformis TaxID=6347 RepID=A0A8J1Y1H2_OWEFU|nr:unnamed protein product [Owenia fusiformis]